MLAPVLPRNPRSLGHFALVHRLQGVLEATARSSGEPGRVVVLASSAHFGPYMPEGVRSEETIDSKEGYSPWGAYGQSKLCNVLFARWAVSLCVCVCACVYVHVHACVCVRG